MIYRFMIHKLAKVYGISKTMAAIHTEFDFWEMTAFENLETKQQEYLVNQTKENFFNF